MSDMQFHDGITEDEGVSIFVGITKFIGLSIRRVIAAIVPGDGAYFTDDATTNRYYTDDAKANKYFARNQ